MSDEPTLSDILGAAGAPFPVEHGGRVWRVGPPTKAAADAFHKFVLAAALQGAREADAEAPGLGAVGRLTDQITDGKHKPGGELWVRWAFGPKADSLFLAALLYQHHPDVTPGQAEELLAARPADVEVALMAVVPDFFEVLAGDERMPRPVAAALRERLPGLRASAAAFLARRTAGGSTGPSSR